LVFVADLLIFANAAGKSGENRPQADRATAGKLLMVNAANISVVMPLYNKGPYVGRAIVSALKQTQACTEILVVDDGSTDDGAATVEKVALQDGRIRLIRQDNSGPGSARNRGVREAKGDFIAFLDADDEWESHFLELANATVRRFPEAGACAMAYRMVYPNGSRHELEFHCGVPAGASGIIDNYFQALFDGAPPIWTSSVMIRREVFGVVGNFPPIARGEDTAFWSAVAVSFPIAFANVVSSTFHLDADTKQRAAMRYVLVDEVDAKHVLEPLDRALCSGRLTRDVAAAVRRYRRKRLAEMIRQNLMCGHPGKARRIYSRFGRGGQERLLMEPRVPLYLAATWLPPIFPKTYWNFHHWLWAALKR
jgi:glycosyltransferase involved in cell wall biosynthesis